MQIHGDLTINGRKYRKGDEIPWYFVYPFFLFHMGVFGLSGFFMAYASEGPGLVFLYMHGGIACVVYLIFYLVIFGIDRVRWMFINAGLGLFGIYAQIDWILSAFGKRAADYSAAVHFIPFFYYVLYTFLLHQMLLDLSRARDNERRRRWIDAAYIAGSLLVYGTIWLSQR
ncbi:hypothetical protein WM2015_2526 [Wenzhouxiangella marina]|uniref:Uncharacterized protein n=2 Tax=Wenzhouxiangella marina TaxID=1579979 RepID=A0A0K0XYW6_9GAMM|nr:hypothetical protein WM2015_2526 [Wenzhouxiangella marina]